MFRTFTYQLLRVIRHHRTIVANMKRLAEIGEVKIEGKLHLGILVSRFSKGLEEAYESTFLVPEGFPSSSVSHRSLTSLSILSSTAVDPRFGFLPSSSSSSVVNPFSCSGTGASAGAPTGQTGLYAASWVACASYTTTSFLACSRSFSNRSGLLAHAGVYRIFVTKGSVMCVNGSLKLSIWGWG